MSSAIFAAARPEATAPVVASPFHDGTSARRALSPTPVLRRLDAPVESDSLPGLPPSAGQPPVPLTGPLAASLRRGWLELSRGDWATALGTFRGAASVRTWLQSIARNKANDVRQVPWDLIVIGGACRNPSRGPCRAGLPPADAGVEGETASLEDGERVHLQLNDVGVVTHELRDALDRLRQDREVRGGLPTKPLEEPEAANPADHLRGVEIAHGMDPEDDVSERFHPLKELHIHFHVAAVLRDFLGNLLDHSPHEFWHRVQPFFGRRSPGKTALRHRVGRFGHAGRAAHSSHHLTLELFEDRLGDLRIAEFPCLFFREPTHHPPQETRSTLHALQSAFRPSDVGGDRVVRILAHNVPCLRCCKRSKSPSFSPSCYWLSNSLSSLPALKKGTFLAGTATVAPVFGLRPSFIRRDLRRKLPNPRISVLSPFFKESRTQSKIVLTTISACRLVSVVTCSETRSIICAFVISGSPFAATSIGPPFHRV